MAHGVFTSLERLLELRHPAGQLELFARQRSAGSIAGSVRSSFRGRGLDFAEVRNYQPGDEIRAIDWRVTARTGVAHTKLYSEDRERPVLIVVDLGPSMRFGTQRCFKSAQAAECAALLAWAALQHNDRVGGLVFNEHEQIDIRPQRRRRALLSLFAAIDKLQRAAEQGAALQSQRRDAYETTLSINAVLGEVRRLARPGTAIFILSDFHGLDDEGAKQLHLLKRHNDVQALLFVDPMERALPRGGLRLFSDGRHRLAVNTSARELRNSFAQHAEQRQQALLDTLAARAVPCLEIVTTDDAVGKLAQQFGRRQARPLRAGT